MPESSTEPKTIPVQTDPLQSGKPHAASDSDSKPIPAKQLINQGPSRKNRRRRYGQIVILAAFLMLCLAALIIFYFSVASVKN